MASDEKQSYIKRKYIDNIKNYRDVYEERKEFLKNWSTPTYNVEMEEVDGQTPATNGDGGDIKGETPPSGGGGEDPRGLIALGKTKIGADYVFGAAGPNVFDCSGFVYWVCKQKGATFGRTNAAGFHSMFTKVNDPVPGDIIFFSNTYKPGISHIGIYMGNNEFIHTANNKDKLEINTLNNSYWKSKFTDIRRIPDKYWGKASGGKALEKSITMTRNEEEWIGDNETYPPEGNSGYSISKQYISYSYNPIVRVGGIITIKNTREEFLRNRIGWARENNYESFVSLNKEKFIHFPSVDDFEGNLYSPDAKKIFEDLLLKTKKPYFEVISGFRFGKEGYLSPHEAGCAIDIKVEKIDEARELADCAWQLGIRAIAFGGSFKDKTAYVHIDIAPASKRWSYGTLPVYNGPGNWIYNI